MTDSPEVAALMRRADEYAAITRDTAREPGDELEDSDLVADFRITLEGFIRRLVEERDAYKADAERLAEVAKGLAGLIDAVLTTGDDDEGAVFRYLMPEIAAACAEILAAHDARQQEQADAD